MDAQKRKAIGLGLIGLILIVLGIKYMPFLLAFAGQQSSMNDKPVILFFQRGRALRVHGRADPTRRTTDGELAGRAARRDPCDAHRHGSSAKTWS